MNARKRMIYAIKDLLDIYTMDQITVDMIAEKSDLSKTTFYRYFQDKYILMQEYYLFIVENVLSNEDSTFEEVYTNLLLFINNNKSYFIELTKQHGNDSFFSVFYNSSFKNSIDIIESNKQCQLNAHERKQVSFFVAGCAYLTEQWINNNINETPKEFLSVIISCIPPNLKDYLL